MIKVTIQEQSNGKDTQGKVLGGMRAPMPSPGTSPFQHLNEFTNLDAL